MTVDELRRGPARVLFALGCALNAVLTFVPSYTARVGFWNPRETTLSDFTVIRMTFSHGQAALGFFLVAMFCVNVLVAVLAWNQPKRWVFIVGASLAAFSVAIGVFSGDDGVHHFIVPQTLSYLATALMLLGFVVKTETPRDVSLAA